MANSVLRRLVPDRFAPALLLASGRSEAAALRLGAEAGTERMSGEIEQLKRRIETLEAEAKRRDGEHAAALDFFDRTLQSIESRLDRPA